jgi:hypothetical protein
MNTAQKLLFLGILFFLKPSLGSSQTRDKYLFSNKIFNLQFLYNYHRLGGDYAKTFGDYSSVGFGGMLKTKNNWVLSGEGNFLFGSDIRATSILDQLVTSGGYISSASGNPGNYKVNMRGLSFYLQGGRVFAWNKKNMNSGILLKGGIGFLQHKIGINLNEKNIPQLDENYAKGYDRLSNGVSFNQFIGYNHQSVNRLINFYAGIEFMQAQTVNRRGFNYDEMKVDKGVKLDQSISFRFGWMIPIYMNTKDENEFQFK